MQIDPLGRIIGGIGRAGVFVHEGVSTRQVQPAPNGQAAWWGLDLGIFQTDNGHLWATNVTSGSAWELDAQAVTLARGANGSYGVWVAAKGVRFSWGATLADAKGVLGAADDGTIFTITGDYTAIQAWRGGSLLWTQAQSFPVIYYP